LAANWENYTSADMTSFLTCYFTTLPTSGLYRTGLFMKKGVLYVMGLQTKPSIYSSGVSYSYVLAVRILMHYTRTSSYSYKSSYNFRSCPFYLQILFVNVGRWVDNIKMDLREIGWDGMEWIELGHDRDQQRAPVNTVMNLRVP
jgi:hypothetical protein